MKNLFLLPLFLLLSNFSYAKTVRYELTITKSEVNLSGKKNVDFALMVNRSIPAPTLEFTEGDDAEITVKNGLANEEVSIHWHGLLLPPEEDGVAYVNTPPIFPGKERTFRFKIRQHGTFWYHSHTMLQEQKGVYGAFIIHPREKKIAYDKDLVVVLSDWSDENADQIMKNLRKDGDYYLHKKKSIRSYLGAIQAGGLTTMLKNEWDRMGGMDLSDVGYDSFLMNGKKDSQLLVAHPGERIRIRVINAAASSYFYLSLGKYPFQVISADGVDIQSVWSNEILMGMAETYDILFSPQEHKNYELRATSQDVTGYSSGWIGMGQKISARDKPIPNLYSGMDHSMMSHGTHESEKSENEKIDHSTMDHRSHGSRHQMQSSEDHSKHKAESNQPNDKIIETLTVDEIKAQELTVLPKNAPIYDLKLVLGGDMERYIWHINGEAIHEDRNIDIKEGELIRFTFVNDTMMHHPMHLHGHFFRVINQYGDYSPLKHTVDVPPHGTRVIEFYANEPGQWMLHCHNLYHMKTGMARVIRYTSFKPSKEMAEHDKHDPHLHDHIYWDAALEAATNHASALIRFYKTWDTLELEVETSEHNKKWEIEGDLFYRRWLSKYLNFIGGGSSFEEHQRAVIGVGYQLPMMVEAQLLVDHKGKLRADIERKFQWTSHIFSDTEFTFRQNKKVEWEINLMYAPNWHWAGGLMLTDDKLGAGLQLRF
ncbi:MAG: multicopper oxidase domain-containing protein [Oligoflexia bacterium]|nr:multicopper oxidase domain-containing protein [Oligoflexia bacterium]